MLSLHDAEAQGLKKLREVARNVEGKAKSKIENKIDEEINNKIYNKTDETLEKWFGSGVQQNQLGLSGSSTSQSGNDISGFGAFGLNSNASTESVYSFDYKVSHFFESTENGKLTRSRMISYINNTEPYFALEFKTLDSNSESYNNSTDAYMIMDSKNMAMVMLVSENEKRSSIVFSIPESDSNTEANEPFESVDSDMSSAFDMTYGYQEIGTRTISGFSAKGYRTGDSSADIEIWITDETIKGYEEIITSNSSIPLLTMFAPYATRSGMVVEMVLNDRQSGSKTTMRVEEGSGPTSLRISMSDWPRTM